MLKFKLSAILISSLILVSCAAPNTMAPSVSSQALAIEKQKQRELFYAGQINNQDKLYKISYPIMTKNYEACNKDIRPLYGMVLWNLTNVTKLYKKSAQNIFGLTNQLTVRTVAPRSAAGKSGIKQKDLIISIDNVNIPEGKKGIEVAVKLLGKGIEKPIKVKFSRNGRLFTKTLRPVKGCKYPVLLDNSSQLNAYADGNKIVISKGMLRFVENNNELALVVAHELSHNSMLHINKKKVNTMAGALGGGALDVLLGAAGVNSGGQFSQLGASLGNNAHSVAFEQEADYVGMYFLARAGYDTSYVANFWRRLSSETGASIDRRTSHPTSPERFLGIEKTHQEIAMKRRKGLKLVPNLRK